MSLPGEDECSFLSNRCGNVLFGGPLGPGQVKWWCSSADSYPSPPGQSGSTSFLDYEKSRTLKTLRPSVAHPEEYYADHDVQPAPCLVAPGAYLYARPLNASLDGIMQFEVTCSLPLDVPAE